MHGLFNMKGLRIKDRWGMGDVWMGRCADVMMCGREERMGQCADGWICGCVDALLIRTLNICTSIRTFSYICAPECPGGEIGRRTVFRSQRSQGCAGSNPVLGTSQ
jgi:hypothetical protein